MTSRLGPIPDWDPSGFLPPFLDSPTSEGGRSPYYVGLTDFAQRFGDTSARRTLLTGLLDYRAALHAAGVRNGFQWVNGSFVEDTTQHAQREPGDIDLVTFLQLPGERTQAQLAQANPSLFDPGTNRLQYGVDTYAVILDAGDLPYLVRRSAYWNGLWSHDRNRQWKGYLEIDLSDIEDAAARAALGKADNREVEE